MWSVKVLKDPTEKMLNRKQQHTPPAARLIGHAPSQ